MLGPARDGPVLWATDRFFAGDETDEAARPAEAARRARLFRVSPEGLDRPLARALAPEGLPEGRVSPRSPFGRGAGPQRRRRVARGSSRGPGNVAALVLSGLATAARLFGGARDARYWGLAAPEGAEARERALKAYYRFLDDTLADVLEREGKERTICLFAPVGWGPPTTAEAVVAVSPRARARGRAGRGARRIRAPRRRRGSLRRAAHLRGRPRPRPHASRPRGRASRARHGRARPRRGVRRAVRGIRERSRRHDVRAGRTAVTRRA